MTSYTVVIPTTNYLVGISNITIENPLVSSVICENNNLEALPISNRYHSFVKSPTGIIEKLTGHSSFRVDLTKKIDQGDSWQLPMAIAHVLLNKNILTFSSKENLIHDEKTNIIWTTGKITSNLKIQPISYLEQKFQNSIEFFKSSLKKNLLVNIVLSSENEVEFKNIISKNPFMTNAINKGQIKLVLINDLSSFFKIFKISNNNTVTKKTQLFTILKKKLSLMLVLFFTFLFLYLINNILSIINPLFNLKENDNYRLLLTELSSHRQGSAFQRIGAYIFDHFQNLEFKKLKSQVSLKFLGFSDEELFKEKCARPNKFLNLDCQLMIEATNIGKNKIFIWMLVSKFENNNDPINIDNLKKPYIVNGMISSKETISINVKTSEKPLTLFFVYGKKFDNKIRNWLINLNRRKSLLVSTRKRIKSLGYGYIIKKINNVRVIQDVN